jgi:hypothetical protein
MMTKYAAMRGNRTVLAASMHREARLRCQSQSRRMKSGLPLLGPAGLVVEELWELVLAWSISVDDESAF